MIESSADSPLAVAALGFVALALGLRLLASGVDLLLEAAGAVFVENVTAPAKEGI